MGGEYYNGDGESSALDTPEAYKAFKFWTDMYANYGIDAESNFFTRIRTGTMPIGISNYTGYLQLLTSAPELYGRWSIAPVPGTVQADGTVSHAVGTTASTAGVILSQSDKQEAAWTFLKWWMSAETQTRYGRELEAILGTGARWNTANVESFFSLPWDARHAQIIKAQMESAREQMIVPGGYFTGRHIINAWNKGMRAWLRKNAVGYAFLMPFLVLFAIFVIVPVGVAMYYSLTNYNMIQAPKFVGLSNYAQLILDDDVFLISLKNTLLLAVVTGPLGYFASFLMAWIITLVKKGRGFFSMAFYAPSLTSGVAMSTIWLILFSGDRYGYINNLLLRFGIIMEPILWTKDADYVLPVIMIITIWMSMGNGFLSFLAGFQNIDPSMYEAGRVDGIKNKFQELRLITIPLMKPQMLFGAINSIVGAFAVFDVATAVAGMPSPNYAAHTIVAHLYDYAFTRFNMGYASSVAMVLFLITFFLGRLCMRLFHDET